MLKFIKAVLGFMIAGMFVMSVWDAIAYEHGILGGYFASIIIIGPMWYLNHRLGLIDNKNGVAFVDMALGIGIAGIARDVFMKGTSEMSDSFLTFVLVIFGGVLAGIVSAAIEKRAVEVGSEEE